MHDLVPSKIYFSNSVTLLKTSYTGDNLREIEQFCEYNFVQYINCIDNLKAGTALLLVSAIKDASQLPIKYSNPIRQFMTKLIHDLDYSPSLVITFLRNDFFSVQQILKGFLDYVVLFYENYWKYKK